MTESDLQRESTELLQRLLAFNTVNPPGNERPAIEYLEALLAQAGFATRVLAAEADRPNLVATLPGSGEGPTLLYLGHVDTVLADSSEWSHGPWSGDVADGYVWGRGAIDMKSQVAAEAIAGLALAGERRRLRGTLKLVFVSDEETGGDLGAQYLTREHPDEVRCDLLLNEGAGAVFEYGGRRRYGVCCGEKGVFRFTITATGVAGHASIPRTGENALLKLAPVLGKLGGAQPGYDLTEAPAGLLRSLGEDEADPAGALARMGERDPALQTLLEPLFGVTLTPTMTRASGKINVIPSRASISVDCRVPPGLGTDVARRRIDEVLGAEADGLQIEFIETVTGNSSPLQTPLMSAIEDWVAANDPGAEAVPVLLPGFSDSRWFREAFPECVAYGFFPHRHMTLLEQQPMMHSANERIDVRDLAFAARFYRDLARRLLG